jgi:hypothetical protein
MAIEGEDRREVKFTDMFDPRQPRSSEELAVYRLDICKTCIFFDSKYKKCQRCGCFMKLKTKLHNAFCPEGKW